MIKSVFVFLILLNAPMAKAHICDRFKENEIKELKVFPQNKAEFCSKNARTMLEQLCFKHSRLGRDNDGGIFGLPTGVCWWHSQLTRNINYLAIYDVQDKTPISDLEFKEILKRLDSFMITRIQGYESFSELVLDGGFPNRKRILQKYLQKEMGKTTAFFGWGRGLKGKANQAGIGKNKNKQRQKQLIEIKKIFNMIHAKRPVAPYVLVQNPGFPSHSYIVYDIDEVNTPFGRDYKIRVQDSNFGRVKDPVMAYYFSYELAQWLMPSEYQKFLNLKKAGKPFKVRRQWTKDKEKADEIVFSEDWTIFVQRNRDLEKINRAYSEFCQKSLF